MTSCLVSRLWDVNSRPIPAYHNMPSSQLTSVRGPESTHGPSELGTPEVVRMISMHGDQHVTSTLKPIGKC